MPSPVSRRIHIFKNKMDRATLFARTGSTVVKRVWMNSSSVLAQSINHDYIGKYRGNIHLYHTHKSQHELVQLVEHWLQEEITGYGMIWVESEMKQSANVGTTRHAMMTMDATTCRVPEVMNPRGCCVVFAEQILGAPDFQHPLLCLTDGAANVIEVVMPRNLKPKHPPRPRKTWHQYHSEDDSFVDWSGCLQMLIDGGHIDREESGQWHTVRNKVRQQPRKNPTDIDPQWGMFMSLFKDIGRVLEKYRDELDNPTNPDWLRKLAKVEEDET